MAVGILAGSIDSALIGFQRRIILQHAIDPSLLPPIPVLYDQLANNASRVLQEELPYEDTPDEARRIRAHTSVANWIDSCNLAQSRFDGRAVADIEGTDDGLVLVAHVIVDVDGNGDEEQQQAITSWSLGFTVGTKEGVNYVVSCSHTLESVSHISLMLRNRMSACKG